jgi:OmpA-OmpF porin, OOP family
MHLTRSLFVVFLATLAPLAAAKDSPWYVGISAGESRTDRELVKNREATLGSALRTDFDATGSAYKIFAGYRFTDMIAVEANYSDLGRNSTSTSVMSGHGFTTATVLERRKINGYGADLVLSVPVPGNFSVFGRVGAFRARVTADEQVEGQIFLPSGSRSTVANETVLRYGVGGDWWFRPNVALRLEWERYSNVGKPFTQSGTGTGEANIDAFLLGVMMRF